MKLRKIISLHYLRLNICLMCELNIYLCFRMLQSREVKEDKKSSSLCNYIFQPKECSVRVTFLLLKSYAEK